MGVGWVCINKKIRGAVGAARILIVVLGGGYSFSSSVSSSSGVDCWASSWRSALWLLALLWDGTF